LFCDYIIEEEVDVANCNEDTNDHDAIIIPSADDLFDYLPIAHEPVGKYFKY